MLYRTRFYFHPLVIGLGMFLGGLRGLIWPSVFYDGPLILNVFVTLFGAFLMWYGARRIRREEFYF